MIRNSRILLAALVAAVVIWAPLPFGSVTTSSRHLLVVLLAILLLIAARTLEWGELRPLLLPVVGLASLAAMGFLQATGWPARVAGWLSPGHARLVADEGFGVLPLSLAPHTSRATSVLCLSLAAAAIAAFVASRDRRGRTIVLASMVGSALLQIGLGVLFLVRSPSRIWRAELGSEVGRLRGTFVNPDHLAFHLGLALPLVTATLLMLFRRRLFGQRRDGWLPIAATAGVWLVLFVGLAASGSRAGLLVGMLVATMQSLLVAAVCRKPLLALPGGFLVVAGTLGVLWLNATDALGRLATTSAYEIGWSSRLEAYRATWRLFLDFPIFGVGLGGFRQGFALVRPPGLEGDWLHAHSDPLELMATVGLVGSLLALLTVIPVVRWLAARVERRARTRVLLPAVGGLGALLAAFLHSLVDFGFTMPANATALVVLLAAAMAIGRVPEGQRTGAWSSSLSATAGSELVRKASDRSSRS